MNFDLYYPHNIKYFDPIPLINIQFINNEQEVVHIYYIQNKKVGKLATVLPALSKREYQFPKNSKVGIFLMKDLKNPYRIVKLINGTIYIIP
tara:strand:+ start:347 stop:622 length:276 start_codon:yes stop_codon:yes gene_type:complete